MYSKPPLIVNVLERRLPKAECTRHAPCAFFERMRLIS